MDLNKLSKEDAALVQHGLAKLGFYKGDTFGGVPGPNTHTAYLDYLDSLGARAVPIATTSPDLAGELVKILMAEVGVMEDPKNSNTGKRVKEYQAATWLEGTGWKYCAAFVCFGILELSKRYRLPFNRPQTAGAWDFENWARAQGVTLIKPPRTGIRKGDILVFTFPHIGVAVEDEANNRVKTVEGNTDSSGSSDGGGVYVQYRRTSLVRSVIRLS